MSHRCFTDVAMCCKCTYTEGNHFLDATVCVLTSGKHNKTTFLEETSLLWVWSDSIRSSSQSFENGIKSSLKDGYENFPLFLSLLWSSCVVLICDGVIVHCRKDKSQVSKNDPEDNPSLPGLCLSHSVFQRHRDINNPFDSRQTNKLMAKVNNLVLFGWGTKWRILKNKKSRCPQTRATFSRNLKHVLRINFRILNLMLYPCACPCQSRGVGLVPAPLSRQGSCLTPLGGSPCLSDMPKPGS